MILFLDFDGTLHPLSREFGALSQLPQFEKVMRDFPDVQIVISSAWRTDYTLPAIRSFFSDAIGRRIIDVTPCLDSVLTEDGNFHLRQVEIERWLAANGREKETWVALDDTSILFPDGSRNLVWVDGDRGFNESTEIELRRRLNEKETQKCQTAFNIYHLSASKFFHFIGLFRTIFAVLKSVRIVPGFHSYTFEMEVLPQAESLAVALARHFESLHDHRKSSTHPAEHWHIETRPTQGVPIQVLADVLHAWVFEMEYSPKLGDDRAWVGKNITENLARKLVAQFDGEVTVHEVLSSPTMWYEAHWRDFAISSGGRNFLLHLGVTD
ncbi:hypothetical protein AAKU61_001423 [Undibacterium sp. GrIS 1.2]|uniref:HAD domain-containing protein n=1 Tax=Undibacterium sp. GrIS 1.2 TaxID=3143933 RepID=UPI0033909073